MLLRHKNYFKKKIEKNSFKYEILVYLCTPLLKDIRFLFNDERVLKSQAIDFQQFKTFFKIIIKKF